MEPEEHSNNNKKGYLHQHPYDLYDKSDIYYLFLIDDCDDLLNKEWYLATQGKDESQDDVE
jgi:hypothetical protein